MLVLPTFLGFYFIYLRLMLTGIIFRFRMIVFLVRYIFSNIRRLPALGIFLIFLFRNVFFEVEICFSLSKNELLLIGIRFFVFRKFALFRMCFMLMWTLFFIFTSETKRKRRLVSLNNFF